MPIVGSGTGEDLCNASSGPAIAHFKRLQSQWRYINKNKFEPADEDLFICIPDGLAQEMRLFYADAKFGKAIPRDDYRELLRHCHIVLGGAFVGM